MKSVVLSQMRHLVRLLRVVGFSPLDRFQSTRLWTPPADLVGARSAEHFHPRRPVRETTPKLFIDVKVPCRVRVEAGEDSFLIATRFSGLPEDDLRVAVLAKDALEGNVTEYIVPVDGTPEELEQRLTVSVEYFKAHCWADSVRLGHSLRPRKKHTVWVFLSQRSGL